MAAIPQTYDQLLRMQARQRPTEVAAIVPFEQGWRQLTWEDLSRQVDELAMALLALDVKAGDRIAIIADASIDWVVADLAIMSVGAVSAVILHRLPIRDWPGLIHASGCTLAFVAQPDAAEDLNARRHQVSSLRHIISLQPRSEHSEKPDPQSLFQYDLIALRRLGRQVSGGRKTLLQARIDQRKVSDLATLMYTAGTTDDLKIVAHSYDALNYELSALSRLELLDTKDLMLLGMPLSHAFARVMLGLWLRSGAQIAFADSITDIFDHVALVRPTVFVAAARVYESLYGTVVRSGQEARGAKSRVFSWAMNLARDHRRGVEMVQGRQGLEWSLAQRLVFKRLGTRLRRLFGGRIRRMICGGAALSDRIANFFSYAGFDVDVGYGLTETCGLTCFNQSGRRKLGSVGPALPGSELRLADDGEILIRGRGLLRSYWNEPRSALQINADGFLCTGDVGSLDMDGFLRVEGRKEDRFTMASGLVVSPMNQEMALRTNAFIGHVLIDGEGEEQIVALVSLDRESVRSWALANALPYRDFASLARSPELRKLVQSIIDDRNRRYPVERQIQRFAVLDRSFRIGTELTAGMRVMRTRVRAEYRSILQALHASRKQGEK